MTAVADQKHLALLKQGVKAWNKWSQQWVNNSSWSEVPPPDLYRADLGGANLSHTWLYRANFGEVDLSHANLYRANLGEADLSHANLRRANLGEVNLFRANLSHANISGADLTHANLNEANLCSANLIDANLDGAKLARANLVGAHLIRAKLVHANLKGANLTAGRLAETVFANIDLTSVVGLETCKHSAPSSIDHRTFEMSAPLPLSFLRGVGLPERLIEYLPSVFNHAIQYYSCFISYSTKDQDFADRIHADLQNRGVRCWFAPHDMPIGGKILDEIDTAIRLRDKLLLILSEHSIKSDWVEDEVDAAFEEERKRGRTVLFPIRLDDAVLDTNEAWAAKLRRARHIGDFRNWEDHNSYKVSFERVMRDLTSK
jgi:hypothetical protein